MPFVRPRRDMCYAMVRLLLRSACFALVLALVASNFTESYVSRYAAALLQLARYGHPTPHILDENGVPRVRYARLNDRYYDNPVYVGIYGLLYYDRWTQRGENADFLGIYERFSLYPPRDPPGAEVWKNRFLATADWFATHIRVRTSGEGYTYGVYEYAFPWDYYDLLPPWRSGMAQALALQVLLRAWQLTGNPTYQEAAELTKRAFTVPVEEGGVAYKETPSAWWYEEYAAPGARRSRVPNGMEHALIALHEYSQAQKDREAQELFDSGLAALERAIEAYGDPAIPWTYYDAIGTVANYKYHRLNVALTRRLYDLTGSETLAIYRTWDRWRTPFLVREFLRQKPNYLDWSILLLNYLLAQILVLGGVFTIRALKRRRWV